jgi:hypothetical protein
MWWRVMAGCAIGLAGLLLLLHRGPKPPPSDAGVCWVERVPTGFVPLDHVDNLETCGARLEVVYLRQGRPVRGAYGGINVSVDASAIIAMAPNGPAASLIGPIPRRELDAGIRRLMEANGERTATSAAPPSGRAEP